MKQALQQPLRRACMPHSPWSTRRGLRKQVLEWLTLLAKPNQCCQVSSLVDFSNKSNCLLGLSRGKRGGRWGGEERGGEGGERRGGEKRGGGRGERERESKRGGRNRREGKREREGEKSRERRTDRQADKQTDRQTEEGKRQLVS